MHDDTEAARRALVPTMPAELAARVEAGETVWDTAELTRDFTVTGFLAPFVTVTRKADGVAGTLMFAHSPRYYFAWKADS
jgi:hypothetical protein